MSQATTIGSDLPTRVIEPSRGLPRLELGEVWAYRELLFYLAWRDVKGRYAQTVLGVGWALFQPLVTVAIYTIFFGRVAGISSEGVPYAVFSMAGLLSWNLFSSALTKSSASLLSQSSLVTKVYFPRLVVPIAAVVGILPDLVVNALVLAAFLLFYGISVTPAGLALCLLLLALAALFSLGCGLWFSALTIRYRDLNHLLSFLSQMWLYVSPVIYPAFYVTSRLEKLGLPGWIYGLNPMSGVVSGFRAALFGRPLPLDLLAVSLAVMLVVLFSGILVFRRSERTLADLI